MFETVVIATDGSASVERAVAVAVDFAERFGAAVHALSVVDTDEVDGAPESVRGDLRGALVESAEEDYAREVDADVVAIGTRGRHGENRFLVGSVAERVVRTCPGPVLTVRRLDEAVSGDGGTRATDAS